MPFAFERHYEQVSVADISTIHQVNASSPPKACAVGLDYYFVGKSKSFHIEKIQKEPINFGSWENISHIKPIQTKKKTIVYRCYIQWEAADDMKEEIDAQSSSAKEAATIDPRYNYHSGSPLYLSDSEVSPHLVGTDSKVAIWLGKPIAGFIHGLSLLLGYHIIFDIIWDYLVDRRHIIIKKKIYQDPNAGKFKKDQRDEKVLEEFKIHQKETIKEDLIP